MSLHGIKEGASKFVATALGVVALAVGSVSAQANPEVWKFEWPNTDFEKTIIDYSDILSGGPPTH